MSIETTSQPARNHAMDDPALLAYWQNEYGFKRSLNWLRIQRTKGKAPPYHRDGLKAMTMPEDADAYIQAMRAQRYTGTHQETSVA